MEDMSPTVTLPTATLPSFDQKIVGRVSPLSNEIEEFRGIPYGKVPARWEHSSLRQSLPRDVFEATSNGPQCPQPALFGNSNFYQSHLEFPSISESEFDCLNLFVIRPSLVALKRIGYQPSGEGLPVLVWIHGGGFGFGAATDPIWDPTRLVMRSVQSGTPFIAVCINYRLGAFGFGASSDMLTTQPESSIKGLNFGLRDQKVGLTWVSRNISYFGGDPRKITIGGQSAGGCAVHTHTLEAKLKSERPLFRRTIVQSGALGTLGPLSLERADSMWNKLYQKLGIQEKDIPDRMQYVKELSAADLLKLAWSLKWITFPVVTDNTTVSASSLDCGSKIDLGDVDTVPKEDANEEYLELLLGSTDFDGGMFYPQIQTIKSFDQVQAMFRSVHPSDSSADELMEAYGIVSDIPLPQLHDRLCRFMTDSTFDYPIHNAAQFMIDFQPNQEGVSAKGVQPSTAQRFKVDFGNPWPGPNQGLAHHCVDLIYIFDNFHEDLRAADVREAEAEKSASSTSETGYVSPPESPSVEEPKRKTVKEEQRARISNVDLGLEIQSQWIRFIVKETKGNTDTEDLVTVYNKDRSVSLENFQKDAKWIEARKRFEIMRKHREEAVLVSEKIKNGETS